MGESVRKGSMFGFCCCRLLEGETEGPTRGGRNMIDWELRFELRFIGWRGLEEEALIALVDCERGRELVMAGAGPILVWGKGPSTSW
jgi:hypothetical protein